MFYFMVFGLLNLQCNSTYITPSCLSILDTTCYFDKITGSTLDLIKENTIKVCDRSTCGKQYERMITCLQSTDATKQLSGLCLAQWNARCSYIKDELCYQSRLDFWSSKGYVTAVDVNKYIEGDKSPGIMCSDCTKQQILFERKYDEVTATEMTNATFSNLISEVAKKSCGRGFFDSYLPDYNNLSGVPDTVIVDNSSSLLGPLIGTFAGILLLVLLIGYYCYRKRTKKYKKAVYTPSPDIASHSRSVTGSTEFSEPFYGRNTASSSHTNLDSRESDYYISRPQ